MGGRRGGGAEQGGTRASGQAQGRTGGAGRRMVATQGPRYCRAAAGPLQERAAHCCRGAPLLGAHRQSWLARSIISPTRRPSAACPSSSEGTCGRRGSGSRCGRVMNGRASGLDAAAPSHRCQDPSPAYGVADPPPAACPNHARRALAPSQARAHRERVLGRLRQGPVVQDLQRHGRLHGDEVGGPHGGAHGGIVGLRGRGGGRGHAA